MNFAPKLLLTILTCLAGSQLARCSQTQATPMAVDQGAPTTSAEQKQIAAQAVLQATTQSAANTSQATGQEIVERDPKRQKTSPEENNMQGANEQTHHGTQQETKAHSQTCWLLQQYEEELSPEAQERIKQDKIREIEADRIRILPKMLYALLTCMPKELAQLIASYDAPYKLIGKLDQTFKIVLPQNVIVLAIVPLLLPHGNAVVVGLSNGLLQIFKEQADEKAKGSWALIQTIQAYESAIGAIADLKNQKLATGSKVGTLSLWTLRKNTQKYSLDGAVGTEISIKKIAALSNGNIVVGGTGKDEFGHWQIWDPTTWKKLYDHVVDDYEADFLDLLVLPDDRIIVNSTWQELTIFKQTTNGWAEERTIEPPSDNHNIVSLNLFANNRILRFGTMGEVSQLHVLDKDNYENSLMILQADCDAGEYCGLFTILSDETLAIAINTSAEDLKIKIFNPADSRHTLDLNKDARLKIPIPYVRGREVQHLSTLPSGQLLGAFQDGTIKIWR